MTDLEALAIVKWLQDRKGKTLKLNDKGIDMVCEALEKQIAKKPIVQGLGQRYCSVCGCGGANHQYCARCGQKLDSEV